LNTKAALTIQIMAEYRAFKKEYGWVIQKYEPNKHGEWRVHRPAKDKDEAEYVATMLNDATD